MASGDFLGKSEYTLQTASCSVPAPTARPLSCEQMTVEGGRLEKCGWGDAGWGVIGPLFPGSFSPVLALFKPLPCRCSGPCHLGQSQQLLAQRHSAGELIYIFKILLKYSWFTMLCLIAAVRPSDSVIHIYILFHILFHYGLSQDIEYSSLCYTVGPCCLSIPYIIVCIC